MEFILLLIVGSVIYSAVENYFKNNNSKSKADGYLEKNNFDNFNAKPSKSNDTVEWWNIKQDNISNINTKPTIKTEVVQEVKKETQTIINIYVQQNNPYKKSKSKDENKGHSEKVWRKLGYKIKSGETYSYKFYGNKIFTPDQVEKIGSYQIRYSESGLAKKLLNNTGSKSHAQNILVDDYDLSESKAQRLLNNI